MSSGFSSNLGMFLSSQHWIPCPRCRGGAVTCAQVRWCRAAQDVGLRRGASKESLPGSEKSAPVMQVCHYRDMLPLGLP